MNLFFQEIHLKKKADKSKGTLKKCKNLPQENI